MHHTQRYMYVAVLLVLSSISFTGVGCVRTEKFTQEDIVDIHPAAGMPSLPQVAQRTGWKTYAVYRGNEQGAELHLEKLGKHVLLPDAVPLGFSPDEMYLLLVWTPQGGEMSGLAYINLTSTHAPILLTDANKIPTPGRVEDIRWTDHRFEYDLLGEDDRLTVSVDLDTQEVQTRAFTQ